MASTWTSGTTFQPPSYDEATGGVSEVVIGGNLTFVDFLPDCCDSGGFFSQPKYENFRSLIDRGNEWLRTHPRWEVRTCESVEFKLKSERSNTQVMTYLEHGDMTTWYIRGLRLWIVPSMSFENNGQQIGYMNLVPQQINDPGFFGSAVYESLEEVLERFNTISRTNPIPGRIITTETQEMKFRKNFDPDRSNWTEDGDSRKQFLFVLRIFYEIAPSAPETIGIMDFIPQRTTEGGLFSYPAYEPFSSVVQKASAWCKQHTTFRICNAQSLEIKAKTGQEIDAQKMSYTEHGARTTFYIRILRIVYVQLQNEEEYQLENPNRKPLIQQFTCKTFIPVQLTAGLFVPEFETLDQTKKRLEAWIKVTGAQVISAETAALRLFTGGEAKSGIETTFTYNQSDRDEYWIFIIRLYLNGFYHEPPKELLPPLPDIRDEECCIVI